MKQIFGPLGKVIGFINQSIAALGISAGVAVAFYNVVARYAFDASLTWAAELTIFLFLWSTFFGAAYCFKEDAHISIGILLDKVKPATAKILMIISHSISFIFLAAVSYYGYFYLELVIELEERSIDLDIPMWIPYLVIPVSFAFAAYRVAEKIVYIIATPAEKVRQKSEAEMIISEMEAGAHDDIVKEVEKRTGGML